MLVITPFFYKSRDLLRIIFITLATLLTACLSPSGGAPQTAEPTPTATPLPTATLTPLPTLTPTPEPLTIDSLTLIPQNERIALVPDLNAEVESGLQMYASELRPDVVLAFDLDGNPVKAWNILENRWILISDIPEVSNGSRGKAWQEVGVQVYRKLNGDFLETPFIPPFPVENGVKEDRAVRYYPTFSNVYDLLEYMVNVEGVRYTLQDRIDFSKNDPGGFTKSARETLYRSPSSAPIIIGDFQTPDGKVSFSSTFYRHPTQPGVFVAIYTDHNQVAHYVTLVLDDTMSSGELESLLEKSLANPRSPESIIPKLSY
jgi:hypothetical protein